MYDRHQIDAVNCDMVGTAPPALNALIESLERDFHRVSRTGLSERYAGEPYIDLKTGRTRRRAVENREGVRTVLAHLRALIDEARSLKTTPCDNWPRLIAAMKATIPWHLLEEFPGADLVA